MAKMKTKWICQNCGYETTKYLGKCPDCGKWSSLVEEVVDINQTLDSSINKSALKICFDDIDARCINNLEIDETIRIKTNIPEFDRVLGSGLVQGSLVLIAGDPGIGKSTLLLQASQKISQNGKKLLYVSAEESTSQIKLRAQRLNVNSCNLFVYSQTNLTLIKLQIEKIKPDVLIIDSIQTIYDENISSTQGSVSQIRECTNQLMKIAKNNNTTVLIVGHVTKEGSIAGPKILEHMVDCVIYFEGDKHKSYRILRAMKNRFGNTNEIGVFNMSDSGLEEIANPSLFFLNENRSHNHTPGSVIIATSDGDRPLLLEIQSLVGITPYPSPRRVANGVDYNRVLQILAVLEKRIGLNLSKLDVYINVIGGISINEPASDLGIALSIVSCARDVIINPGTVIIGELGLSGEIRNVYNIEKRIIEAQKLGFNSVIIPKQNKPFNKKYNINIIEVSRLFDAIKACLISSNTNDNINNNINVSDITTKS